MESDSLRTATPADNDTSSRRFPTPGPASLQLLPSGQEVSEILQQMCGEVSQTTTAEIVEVANSAAPLSKLQDLLPVYFYSSQLQSPEAVIIYLLLKQWRDSSERRRDRRAFAEHGERLRARVAELEKKLYESRHDVNRVTAELEESESEINRLMKQVQELQLQNEKLQCAHNEVCVCCLHVRANDDTVTTHTDCYKVSCTSHNSCKILVCNSINYSKVHFQNQCKDSITFSRIVYRAITSFPCSELTTTL